jgi:hypothetical protein
MSQSKKGYFQGTEPPTPKKTKYKPEPAAVVQPRFKEPFFRNYDLYETEGVDGKAKHGPGAGFYQNMDKYKSVSDFLKKRRERNKDKHKADDIKKKRAARRLALLKIAIDFPVDDQVSGIPFSGDGPLVGESNLIGGYLDEYLPEHDFEGKSPDKLDFGRDYVHEDPESHEKEDGGDFPNKEPGLYGLPDGMEPAELDADKTISPRNLDYGTTNSGNTLYNKNNITGS